MLTFRVPTSLAVLTLFFALIASAQAQPDRGGVEVNVKNVKVDGNPAKLSRKRFYMFAGGLKENAALLQRIKSASITSRNCYYKGLKASDQYICWLQQENCESPFCRVVEPQYVDAKNSLHVPEFLVAFGKGMSASRNNTDIARNWLVNYMPDDLVNGYYRQKQTLLASVLGGVKPVQSSMTDTAAVRALFIDIPFAEGAPKKAAYLLTNVLPIEIGNKSYVWSCEREVQAGKSVLLNLAKTDKGCEVVERDLDLCETVACGS